MNRRSLIQVLIGVIATIAGLAVLNVVRQDRCLDAAGQWMDATRSCVGSQGPIVVARGYDVFVAVAIGVLLASMLFRAFAFARRRASPPSA
jgi:hypothetical protein